MARHRKRFPFAIPERAQRREENLSHVLTHSQNSEFQKAISALNDRNPEVQLRAIKEITADPFDAIRSFPSLIRLLPSAQDEIRTAVETSIRVVMPAWLRWHLYEYKSPLTAIAALEQIRRFCPLPSTVISVLQKVSDDFSVIDPIRSAAMSLLDFCDSGNRLASFQKERDKSTDDDFGCFFAERLKYHPKTPKRHYTPLTVEFEVEKEKSLYPRSFPNTHAAALGIRIEEFSRQEFRFFDANTSDLLLVWNRSTSRSRPTLLEFGEMETLGLEQALAQAKTRLHSKRVRVGNRVVLLNKTDGVTETYMITGSHIAGVLEDESLQFNSPLGSQIVGLCEGTEFTAKVPKGEIRYLIRKIY